uniref:Uncharacterized protein n=1 Tax=Vitis vinifera TaxID=29760 RepID=F6I5S2_VITVI
MKLYNNKGLAPGLASHTAEFPTPPANVEAPFNYGNLEKAVNKAASSNISGRYENVALHQGQKSTRFIKICIPVHVSMHPLECCYCASSE